MIVVVMRYGYIDSGLFFWSFEDYWRTIEVVFLLFLSMFVFCVMINCMVCWIFVKYICYFFVGDLMDIIDIDYDIDYNIDYIVEDSY
jgi:hypothetical protein